MIEKIVLRLLALKSWTTTELRKKLSLRRFSLKEIELVIQKFIKLGYLNDQQLSEQRFQTYIGKGYGPHYVAMKMKEQGLSMPFYPLHLQKQVIAELLKKPSFQRKNVLKQAMALHRRGFDLAVVFEIISENVGDIGIGSC